MPSKLPKKFFHNTHKENLSDIRKSGLRAVLDEILEGGPGGDLPGVNLLARKSDLPWPAQSHGTWITIDPKDLKRDKFNSMGLGWWRYNEDIPVDYLRFLEHAPIKKQAGGRVDPRLPVAPWELSSRDRYSTHWGSYGQESPATDPEQGCHEMPHGQDFPVCMECHQQPHAPKVIQFATLEKEIATPDKTTVVTCAVCHKNEGNEFDKFPTKHNTEMKCQGCHAKVHGTIPSCLDCHEKHLAEQEYKDCLVCHSPHSAKSIKKYPENIPNTNCAACHDEVYKTLQENVTKHSAMQCATCHASHGLIPKCQDCHGEPHGEGLHKRFSSCLDCHKDPHNLPVTMKK